MKFTITTKEFKEVIKVLSKGNSQRGQFPNLHILAKENVLTFTYGQMPTVIHKVDNTIIYENGASVVDFETLKKLSAKMKEKEMVFEKVENNFQVVCGKINIKTELIDLEYCEPKFEKGIKVDAEIFFEKLSTVLHSVSKQESRPILTGVNMTINNNNLKLVSTDSHRLSQNTLPITSNDTEEFIFNPKGEQLKKLATLKLSGELSIQPLNDNNYVAFSNEKTTMIVENMCGNYPNTDKLLSNTHQTKLNVSVSELLEAIEVAEIISEKAKHKNVSFKFNGVSKLIGKNEKQVTEIDLPLYEGDELEIYFNPTYMKESLKTFRLDDTVEIFLQSAIRPLQVRLKENIQLITPIRINR